MFKVIESILILLLFTCTYYIHAEIAKSIFDIQDLKYLNGKPLQWSSFGSNKVFLFANVASQCGYTKSGYDHLSTLDKKFKSRGLIILAVPCNQFGNQEPGSPNDILSFVESTTSAKFPLLEKMDVNGANEHPLFTYLKSRSDEICIDTNENCALWAANGECNNNPNYMHSNCQKSCKCPVKWNFEYFLVNSSGKIIKRYRTGTDMTSKPVVDDIETQLLLSSVRFDEL